MFIGPQPYQSIYIVSRAALGLQQPSRIVMTLYDLRGLKYLLSAFLQKQILIPHHRSFSWVSTLLFGLYQTWYKNLPFTFSPQKWKTLKMPKTLISLDNL